MKDPKKHPAVKKRTGLTPAQVEFIKSIVLRIFDPNEKFPNDPAWLRADKSSAPKGKQ